MYMVQEEGNFREAGRWESLRKGLLQKVGFELSVTKSQEKQAVEEGVLDSERVCVSPHVSILGLTILAS